MYKASGLGFHFYDFIFGERYEESPIMKVEDAYQKLLQVKKESEFDNALFVEFEKNYFAHIWFYKSEEGYLQYYLGSFYNTKEKILEDASTSIDFGYYIDIALKLGNDFGIEKLIADHMD